MKVACFQPWIFQDRTRCYLEIEQNLIDLEGEHLESFNHALNLYHTFSLTDLQNFSEDLHLQLLQIFGRDLYSTEDLISDLQNMNIDYYSFFGL